MNKIKYDKKDKKTYLILAVVATILLVACLFALQIDLGVENLSAVFFASFMIVSTLFLPVISFAMWVMFFDSHMYLKRLEKHGFIVPNRKKDYDNDLEKLAGDVENDYDKQDTEAKASNESIILACLSWLVALGMAGYTVWYFIRFSHMLENVGFLGFVCIFITVCWLLFGFYFFKQRDPNNYRDDVNYKSTLKVRKHLVEGIVTIVILLAITIFGAANIYTMSKYVERSKEYPEQVENVIIELDIRLDS